jgi:aurora kinase
MGKKLGKGRFGDVYMVKEKKLGFLLALKVINKQELV